MKQIPNGTSRINRILSLAGIVSRRKADELIGSGRVILNGVIVRELGTKAIWGRDSIMVDGKEIPKPSDRIYLILNKPFGYISSLRDPEGRPIVTDLLKSVPDRVYPVGRLDFDSLGLLLLTNDGDFSHRLTHPRYHIPRTYKVTVDGTVSEDTLRVLRKGVQLEDGFSGNSRAALVKQAGGKSIIRLTITQGRNRLVRRMVEALGYSAVHLIRIGFGNLELGTLKTGQYRHLEPDEVLALKKSVGLN
ncbi:rRNA pseudouridine synthase [Deltaproteobacteria bacterium]|nr:rRNA pseudouridine synthase [Deltaproteobacteria bacterium]